MSAAAYLHFVSEIQGSSQSQKAVFVDTTILFVQSYKSSYSRSDDAKPTYHFKSKDGLLLDIYKRHCEPMNTRRMELLVARDLRNRLEAIAWAYTQPAFSSNSDLAGGGAHHAFAGGH